MTKIRLTLTALTVPTFSLLALIAAAAPYPPKDRIEPAVTPPLVLEPTTFPIAVWLQAPSNAAKFQAIGINLYVGLWDGPTEAQLTALEKAKMPVICDQNAEALKPRWNKTIRAWLQQDEPDNAQELPGGKGYGPPITPKEMLTRYDTMKKSDPVMRPVYLGMGQGVAYDKWVGRGVRSNHPEDYAEYAKAGDIVSFDIYPVVHDKKEVAGNLTYVSTGVERLDKWTDHKKPVWTCIECTHISNPDKKATPAQVKSEVWLAITHGATGIVYFVHQFKPKFVEAGVLQDAEMCAAIKSINAEIQSLAPVIYSPEPKVVATSDADLALMTRQNGEITYVFAVSKKDSPITATITLPADFAGSMSVIGEDRKLPIDRKEFKDTFQPYAVHLYAISNIRK